MAALKKVVLKSTTVMSLNERFTYLRQPSVASTSGGAATLSIPTAMPNLTTARDMAAAHLQHLRPSSQQSNLVHRQPHISPQQYRQQQYSALRRRQPSMGRRGLDSLTGGYEEEDDSVLSISPRSVESPMRGLRSRADSLLPASARNRRLAAQMERRPAVVAALKLKKRSVRQRLGQPFAPSIKDRLTLGSLRGAGVGRGRRGLRARSGVGRGLAGRGVGRGRAAQGNLNRRGNLSRIQSLASLNRSNDSGIGSSAQAARQGQGFRRPFARGSRRGGGSLRTPVSNLTRFFAGRGRSTWRDLSFRSRGGVATRGAQRGARSIRRGARGGRGRGRGANATQPTREELDHQLDEYMAGTRSHLDKELDQYMNQASGEALESWD